MIAKRDLESILSIEYHPERWRQVLTNVFGARNLNRPPVPIPLPANNPAESAFDLGFLNTTDDRLIGLYQVDLKPGFRIERSHARLRRLLRNIYNYDVDGALVVFVQRDKWRLSFISEVRVLHDDGGADKKATEPKRCTYLLGRDEKIRTAADRLSKISGRPLALGDLRAAFSVEALNTEFYKKVSGQFYKLVGLTTSRGKKTASPAPVLTLPGTRANSPLERKCYREFAVRLIGRTMFCWFLKTVRSGRNRSLLPEHLLSSKAAKEHENYYHTILEPLFFQTLNTNMKERVADLPEGCEQIPFLNGGLFEPQPEDFYDYEETSGYSTYIDTLNIPDNWFVEFFEKLEQYNFTIEENSSPDIEISIDPEMLGRIFENLLAEIDPGREETTRKATGSFYTPREIVNYMVDESLLIYLKGKLQTETAAFQDEDKQPETVLRRLFSYEDDENPFGDTETEILIEAIDNCKILDPACGSGAFPLGVLHRLVHLLGKLDPGNVKWKDRQQRKAIAATEVAFELGGGTERERRLLEIDDVFSLRADDYARKIFLIENCIYGVDIQPIAAEISRLRCFLTLLADETIDDRKENRGVKPLPNLEFKFVTADALSRLPRSGSFNSDTRLAELQKIRRDYLQSHDVKKAGLKEQFNELQSRIRADQNTHHRDHRDRRARKLGTWEPFQYQRTDWFDPLWMFGVEAFDIVIGNPPYVLLQNTNISPEVMNIFKSEYEVAQYKVDLYHLFIEQAIRLGNETGIISYLTPNTFLKNKFNNKLREVIIRKTKIRILVRFFISVFQQATVDNAVFILEKAEGENVAAADNQITVYDIKQNDFHSNFERSIKVAQNSMKGDHYSFEFDSPEDSRLLNVLERNSKLGDWGRAYFGIQTYDRKSYVASYRKSNSYVPVVDGTNVKRYFLSEPNEWVEFTPQAIKSGGNPEVYLKDRILVRQIGKYPEGTYCPSNIYTLNTIYNIFLRQHNPSQLKFLLAIINSKVIRFYWLKRFSDGKETFPKIKKSPLESIPIPNSDSSALNPLSTLVDYILLLKETSDAKQPDRYVPDEHLVEQFEEVIDALVCELFFAEDFRRQKIAFIKYAERDFPPIEGLSRDKQIKTIRAAYQKLRHRDNEIHHNLKLMDIRLADLLMPIKTAR